MAIKGAGWAAGLGVLALTITAGAQTPRGTTSAAAAAAVQGPQAQGVGAGTGIRRNTGAAPSLGDFPVDERPAAPPPPVAAGGPAPSIGGTGSVADEAGPHGQMRGSLGPAPGEIDMSRPIGPSDVARLMRLHEPRLRDCYTRAVTGRRNAPGGRVNLRVVIGRDGNVSGPEANGLPELPAVSECLRTELSQLRFPRPESGTLPYAWALTFTPPAPAGPPGRGNRPVRPAATRAR